MLYLVALMSTTPGDYDNINSVKVYDTLARKSKWFPIKNILYGLKMGTKLENAEIDSNGNLVGTRGSLSRYTLYIGDENSQYPSLYKEAYVIVGRSYNDILIIYDAVYDKLIEKNREFNYHATSISVANGKIVDNKLNGINYKLEDLEDFERSYENTAIIRKRHINNKTHKNTVYRVYGNYKLILYSVRNDCVRAADIIDGVVKIRNVYGYKPNYTNPRLIKSRLYKEVESKKDAYVSNGRSVVRVIKMKTATSYIVDTENGEKEISIEELIKMIYSKAYIFDCEIKKYDDALMIKTYFEETYIKIEYVKSVLEKQKRATLMTNKMKMFNRGDYVIDSSNKLVSFTPDRSSNMCTIGSEISIIGEDAFKESGTIDLVIKNENVKFEKIRMKADIDTLTAPDGIIEKLFNLKLNNARRRPTVDKIRLNEKNTIKGYNLAERFVGYDCIEGSITQETALEILKEPVVRLFKYMDGIDDNNRQSKEKGLRSYIDRLSQVRKNVCKLGQAQTEKEAMAGLGDILENYGYHYKDGCLYRDNYIVCFDSCFDDLRVPDGVDTLGNKYRIYNSYVFDNVDFGNIKNISHISISVRGGTLRGDKLEFVSGYLYISNDTKIYLPSLKDYSLSGSSSTDRLDEVIESNNNNIIKDVGENMSVEFYDGTPVPDVILDNLDEFRIVGRGKLAFTVKFRNADSICYGSDKMIQILNHTKRVEIDDVKFIDTCTLAAYGSIGEININSTSGNKIKLFGGSERDNRIKINCEYITV